MFANATDTLTALASAEFDPRQVVYLPPSVRSAVPVRSTTRCEIRAAHFDYRWVELDVDAAEPCLGVLAQTYYHPWRATVDGRATPLWRANHAFQALSVPAGRHTVQLQYRDRRLLQGAALSALAVLVCAILWRRKREIGQPDA